MYCNHHTYYCNQIQKVKRPLTCNVNFFLGNSKASSATLGRRSATTSEGPFGSIWPPSHGPGSETTRISSASSRRTTWTSETTRSTPRRHSASSHWWHSWRSEGVAVATSSIGRSVRRRGRVVGTIAMVIVAVSIVVSILIVSIVICVAVIGWITCEVEDSKSHAT